MLPSWEKCLNVGSGDRGSTGAMDERTESSGENRVTGKPRKAGSG